MSVRRPAGQHKTQSKVKSHLSRSNDGGPTRVIIEHHVFKLNCHPREHYFRLLRAD